MRPCPLTNILKNLPQEYTRRQKHYFIPNTRTLKPTYAHLEQVFKPYLKPSILDPPKHDLTHLQRHNSLLSKDPTQHHQYALILTYNPISKICNQQMAQKLDPRYLTILRRLHKLPVVTQTDATYKINHHHHNTTTTIITQAYFNINNKITRGFSITPNSLRNELPHIPPTII